MVFDIKESELGLHFGGGGFAKCEKTFSKSDNLKSHIMIHTGETPYSCKQYDKTFFQSSSLKTHNMIHTGDKPHHCKQCDKIFSEFGSSD